MSAEQLAKISKISKTLTEMDKLGGEQLQKIAPNREYFEKLMATKTNKQEQVEQLRLEDQKKLSPMEEVSRSQRWLNEHTGRNLRGLVAQVEQVNDKFESAKRKLSTPELKLKRSVANVLQNKLTHIDESLKVALSKVGVDYQPPEVAKGLLSPVKKFLGYLTHGQHQLESLSSHVTELEREKGKLSPGKVLTIQMKMGVIQNELEFFAGLLNKSLESIKTIMNVQV